MTFGSNRGMVAQNQSAVTDEQGNAIVNAGNSFGDSPAGNALLTQALFGLPNGTLSLTPPDVYSGLSNDNQVPYWQFADYSNGVMAGSAIYDATTQTWGVIINPGTAASGDYCTFTTRSYLVNDDNLGLRQRATTVISKGGTAAASTQWNLTLSATYYDSTNTAVSTAVIGTALDTGTWTSISGYTTTGGSAITAAARYVDLQYKLTATAAVTGSATVTIKSLFLATKIGANASFNIADVYVANGTWTRPSGVDYVTVVAIGGGGGGASGPAFQSGAAVTVFPTGSSGGGGSRVAYLPNFYVGDQTSVSIGVGAGGSGGTARNTTKTLAGTAQVLLTGTNGSAGGASTFGSYLSVGGGGGGIGGTVYTASGSAGATGGTAAGASTTNIFGLSEGIGGVGGAGGTASGAAGAPGTTTIVGTTLLPFVSGTYAGAGAAGGVGTVTVTGTISSNGVGTAAAGGGTGYVAGGGGASGGTAVAASAGGSGGGGGAGAARIVIGNAGSSGTATGTAGAGGSAAIYSGAGGGAGGMFGLTGTLNQYNAISVNITSGVGGVGGGGIVVVGYTA